MEARTHLVVSPAVAAAAAHDQTFADDYNIKCKGAHRWRRVCFAQAEPRFAGFCNRYRAIVRNSFCRSDALFLQRAHLFNDSVFWIEKGNRTNPGFMLNSAALRLLAREENFGCRFLA